jgi:hypothetical protein
VSPPLVLVLVLVLVLDRRSLLDANDVWESVLISLRSTSHEQRDSIEHEHEHRFAEHEHDRPAAN